MSKSNREVINQDLFFLKKSKMREWKCKLKLDEAAEELDRNSNLKEQDQEDSSYVNAIVQFLERRQSYLNRNESTKDESVVDKGTTNKKCYPHNNSSLKIAEKSTDSHIENKNTSSSVNYEKFQTGNIHDSLQKNSILPGTVSSELSSDPLHPKVSKEKKDNIISNVEKVDSAVMTDINTINDKESLRKNRKSKLTKDDRDKINSYIKNIIEESPSTNTTTSENNGPADLFVAVNLQSVQFIKFDQLKWLKSSEIKSYGWYSEWRFANWNGIKVTIRRVKSHSKKNSSNLLLPEINALTLIRHPNVLMLMGFTMDTGNSLMPIYEHFRYSLYSHIHEMACAFSLRQIIELSTQITEALSFIHQLGIIHTTLSSHSIVLSDNFQTAKLCAFDYSINVNKENDDVKKPDVKSDLGRKQWYQWLAPEFFKSNISKIDLTESVDVYSFCIVLWECCFLIVPWKNISCSQLTQIFTKWKMGIAVSYNSSLPLEIHEILKNGLNVDWRKRNLTVNDMLQTFKRMQKQYSSMHDEIFLLTTKKGLTKLPTEKVIVKKYDISEVELKLTSSTTPSPRSVSTLEQSPKDQQQSSNKSSNNTVEKDCKIQLENKQFDVIIPKIVGEKLKVNVNNEKLSDQSSKINAARTFQDYLRFYKSSSVKPFNTPQPWGKKNFYRTRSASCTFEHCTQFEKKTQISQTKVLTLNDNLQNGTRITSEVHQIQSSETQTDAVVENIDQSIAKKVLESSKQFSHYSDNDKNLQIDFDKIKLKLQLNGNIDSSKELVDIEFTVQDDACNQSNEIQTIDTSVNQKDKINKEDDAIKETIKGKNSSKILHLNAEIKLKNGEDIEKICECINKNPLIDKVFYIDGIIKCSKHSSDETLKSNSKYINREEVKYEHISCENTNKQLQQIRGGIQNLNKKIKEKLDLLQNKELIFGTKYSEDKFDIKRIIAEHEMLIRHIRDSVKAVNIDHTKIYIRNTVIKPASHRNVMVTVPAVSFNRLNTSVKNNNKPIMVVTNPVPEVDKTYKQLCIDELKNFFEEHLWQKEKARCLSKIRNVSDRSVLEKILKAEKYSNLNNIKEHLNAVNFITNLLSDIVEQVLITNSYNKNNSNANLNDTKRKLCDNCAKTVLKLLTMNNNEFETIDSMSVNNTKINNTIEKKNIQTFINFIKYYATEMVKIFENKHVSNVKCITDANLKLEIKSSNINGIRYPENQIKEYFESESVYLSPILFPIPAFFNYWDFMLRLYLSSMLQERFIDDDFSSEGLQLIEYDDFGDMSEEIVNCGE